MHHQLVNKLFNGKINTTLLNKQTNYVPNPKFRKFFFKECFKIVKRQNILSHIVI